MMALERVSKKYCYPEIIVNPEVYWILQAVPPHDLVAPEPPAPPVYPYNPRLLPIYSWVGGGCLVLYLLLQSVSFLVWVSVLSGLSFLLLKVRFRFALDTYHAARAYAAAYEVRVAEYDKQLKQLFPAGKLWEYRLALLQQYLSTTKQPENLTPNDKRQVGNGTGTMFHKYLVECFGTAIHADKKVQVLHGSAYSISYYPDFVYQDQETGLCIDIEIDEPFDVRTNTPTHCVGKDDDRNRFFVENKWVVIRFTEEQVVNWPELCCKEIALTIFDITKVNYAVKEFVASLPQQKKWMEYEAKALAEKLHKQDLVVWE
ncbi:hypothetical protein [Hymenobacter sp.]|uniref:hypothetical protein n=1 Tax=Hymenobacter sp. TaxID=1898978 RepID=UPI002EDAF965